MRKWTLISIAALMLSAASSRKAFCEQDFSTTYAKANGSVVLIDFKDGARQVGSGVVVGVTTYGAVLILTANHVVKGYDICLVSFSGRIEQYIGRVSSALTTERDDLAIVVVKKPPAGLEMVTFAASAARKGKRVGTIGHPQGEPYTWSEGAIKNIFLGKYILHDAKLDVGSSGGPLLDPCGRMLGMNVELHEKPSSTEELDEESKAVLDTVQAGDSATLASGSILPILENWLSEVPLKEKWKVKRYCSFLEKMYKHPVYITVEAIGVGIGIVGWSNDWWRRNGNGNGLPVFGEPPGPPN